MNQGTKAKIFSSNLNINGIIFLFLYFFLMFCGVCMYLKHTEKNLTNTHLSTIQILRCYSEYVIPFFSEIEHHEFNLRPSCILACFFSHSFLFSERNCFPEVDVSLQTKFFIHRNTHTHTFSLRAYGKVLYVF